jgi:uncharacterized protein GlcG (DUF336 family)
MTVERRDASVVELDEREHQRSAGERTRANPGCDLDRRAEVVGSEEVRHVVGIILKRNEDATMNITLDAARDLIARGQALAGGFHRGVTMAIVDDGGYLVAIERMDTSRPLAPSIATAKAYTAAIMQRPTTMLKSLSEDEPMFFTQIGRMGQHEIVAVEGGLPIRRNGRILGGVGVSGATAEEDHQICEAALSEAGYDVDFGG